MAAEQLHFVTGRLASRALSEVLTTLSSRLGFRYTVDELPITVAALMTVDWVARHLQIPEGTSRVLLPGYCGGDLSKLRDAAGVPVERGPRDLHQLADYFDQPSTATDYGKFDIEILAEINHCPRLSLAEILQHATLLQADGADVIDIGCEPGTTWAEVGEVVRALRAEGHRVSIDSLNQQEVADAVAAGAELVLSVNSSNREAAADWGVEVVAIPDDPNNLETLDNTIQDLENNGVPYRIDPILEPIGFGFAASLSRFLSVRQAFPEAAMMMGIGNLTELTDVDSAGINTLLLGFCQELSIRSVLTTQVINWARTSVRECDRARRLMFHSIHHHVLPKHLEPGLLMLRDARVRENPPEEISQLANTIRDPNYRIFAADGEIHLVSANLHLHDADPFLLFQKLQQAGPDGGLPKNLTPSHAFYLGFEMCKAVTAITLGKNYEQDETLDWGLATRPERRHYLKRHAPPPKEEGT